MAEIDLLFAQADSGGAGLAGLKRIVRRKDKNVSVKAYALEKIGELARPGADKFLLHVSGDTSNSVLQHAARLAYLNSRVIREPGQAGKRKILTEAMNAEPMRDMRSWAAEELCGLGDDASLPLIRKTLSSVDSTRGMRRIIVCESKVRLLTKHSVRIEALKSALSDNDVEIRCWGIRQLGKLKTPEAETALVDFASRLQKGSQKENEGLLNMTIYALSKKGWDAERLKKHGIRYNYPL